MKDQFDEKTEDAFNRLFKLQTPINQCDGCAAGIPKTDLGIHYNDFGRPIMLCQQTKYLKYVLQGE